MLSYSPYDNVVNNSFPNLYVTAGLNDQRVTYWEPAKWVQKLRDHNTGSNDILFKVNMGEGHFGKSGRYNSIMEKAEQYAYMIHKLQKK
jgi:oligopeptidase B